MKINELSRAEKCGIKMGEAIVEMANLMYQNNTKRNYFKGLIKVLRADDMNDVKLAMEENGDVGK